MKYQVFTLNTVMELSLMYVWYFSLKESILRASIPPDTRQSFAVGNQEMGVIEISLTYTHQRDTSQSKTMQLQLEIMRDKCTLI